ncbi:uncharacterized protein EAF01_003347 [Botrytis porri]|uniref:uncharacterized protein n=1 Tax=Botrytis porri TaxID=87229 RepID=UPI0018FF472B|nr:uncharacterized protein EAF01_003347 [Botrytis porri]KAF7909629.1 hypothetical protein EAF01_003347 [Botrytis porri]
MSSHISHHSSLLTRRCKVFLRLLDAEKPPECTSAIKPIKPFLTIVISLPPFQTFAGFASFASFAFSCSVRSLVKG